MVIKMSSLNNDWLNLLDNVEIILVEPSHLGNVGSAARAMRTMGLKNLGVVTNKDIKTLEAIALSKGGEQILNHAQIYQDIDEALANKNFVIATSARERSIELPIYQPREAMNLVINQLNNQAKVAFLFGRERTGLTNQELQKADIHVNIDANPEYSSLNLAMSVQVLSYELRQALLRFDNHEINHEAASELKPTHDQIENLYLFLENSLKECGFLKEGHNGKVMGQLRRIFAKADLSNHELQIIYGVMNNLLKYKG